MIDKILQNKEKLIFDNESSPTLIPYCLLAIESVIPSLEEEGMELNTKKINDAINYDVLNGHLDISEFGKYTDDEILQNADMMDAIHKLIEVMK